MEGVSGGEDGVDQVPEFALLEDLPIHGAPIHDFVPQKIGIVLVGDLCKEIVTEANPPLPQNSVLVNLRAMGRKMFSPYLSPDNCDYHFWNYFSLGRGTTISMAPSSSSLGSDTTLTLLNLPWFITKD